MATRKKRIPAKLKHDAIVEALLEVRFDMTTASEILFGRLADWPSWKDFEPGRMGVGSRWAEESEFSAAGMTMRCMPACTWRQR